MKICLIIGAMKSGTTTLYDYLSMHPEICTSQVKEPSFFTETTPSLVQIAKYHALFPCLTANRWACEASTNYAKYPQFSGVPQRIHNMYLDTRLIYILRHPIERIYSHYIHNLAHGREQRSFEDAVLGEDSHYLNVSRYYLQLSQYLEFFPPERILILIFENFVQYPRENLQRIFAFLSIDLYSLPNNFTTKRNVTAHKSLIHPALRALQALPFYNYAPRRLDVLMRRLFQQPTPQKLELLNPIVYANVLERLRDDINQLQNYLGAQITAWDFCRGVDYRP
jgi:hypothetical protein